MQRHCRLHRSRNPPRHPFVPSPTTAWLIAQRYSDLLALHPLPTQSHLPRQHPPYLHHFHQHPLSSSWRQHPKSNPSPTKPPALDLREPMPHYLSQLPLYASFYRLQQHRQERHPQSLTHSTCSSKATIPWEESCHFHLPSRHF